MRPLRLLPGLAAAATLPLALSCMRDRVVSPADPLPAVLAVDRPTVQLFRFARGRMVAADTVRISNNGQGRLGPVQRLGGVDYQEGRSGWLDARVVNLDENNALLVLEPSYAEEEQELPDRAEVVLKGAGASDLKRVTIFARTLPGAKFEFSVSPAAFTAAPGEPPANQTLVVRNGGNGVLRIQPPVVLYEGGESGWLTVARSGGTETSPAFRLQVDPAGLAPGLHEARLRFESGPAEETRALPAALPVQLNVGAPRLGVSTASLGFTVVYGEAAPPPQVVTLSNSGAGSFATLGKLAAGTPTYGPGAAGWLAVAVDSNRAVAGIAPGGIAPGNYAAAVVLHSELGGDQTVQAALHVEAPVLTLSSRSISFGVVRGESELPTGQKVRLTNSGAGTTASLGSLSVSTFAPPAPWITANLQDSAITLTPTAAAAGLAIGTHSTRIIAASQYGGSDTLAVTMAVSRGIDVPSLVLSATDLAFSALRGGNPASPQVVRISNAGGGSLGAVSVAGVAYDGAGGWLTAALQDTTLTLSVAAGSLGNGVHRATVRVASTQGGEASLSIALTVASPILTVSTGAVSFSSQVGGSAGATRTITLSNTGPGTLQTLGALSAGPVSAGWLAFSLTGATLTLTLTSVPGAPGSYTTSVPVNSTNGGAAEVQVTLTVASAPASPDLVVSPSSVRMYGVQGGSQPASQTLLFSNAGGGALGAVGASSSASWLGVSVAGSTATLTANPAGLAAGTHTATVTATSGAGGNEAVDVQLELGAPRLTLSSRSASFEAAQGGAASPALVTITFSNTGAGDFQALGGASAGAIGYSGTGGWLGVQPAGDNALILTASAAALPAGTYSASVPVNSARGGSDVIAVTLTVTPPASAADLVLSSSAVLFAATAGGSDPAGQSITMLNGGGGGFSALGTPSLGTIAYSAGGTGWLTRAVNGSVLSLNAATGALAAGSYTASFDVSTASGGSEAVTVRFAIDTASAPPALGLGADAVEFTAVRGGPSPPDQQVAIFNRGSGGLGKLDLGSISGGSGWLTVPAVGNSELTLHVAPTGLSAGDYQATVTITSGNGGSATLGVTLHVVEPRLTLSARSASFSAVPGGAQPAAQVITVSNTGAGALADLQPLDAGASVPWLQASLNGSQLSLQANHSGRPAGSYQGYARVTSSAGSDSVAVTLTVADTAARPVLAVGTSRVSFVAVRGAPSPAAVSVALSNSGGGTLASLGSLRTGYISYSRTDGWLGTPQLVSGVLTLAPDTRNLPAGTESATVPVQSDNGGTQSIEVSVDVVQPVLTASELALAFTASVGGSSPSPQSLTLSNTGGGTFADLGTVSVQSVSAGWITSPSANSGVTSSSVDFAVSIAGLAAGVHNATVVLASQYGGSRTIGITLSVVRDTDPPRLALSTATQRFTALVGGSDPEPQSVELVNAGGGTLGSLQVGSPVYAVGDGWLSATLAGSTLTVRAATGSLSKGDYAARLPITSSGGGTANLDVTFVVGSPRLTLTPHTVSFADTLAGAGPPPVTVKAANTGGGDIGSLGSISVLPVTYAGDAAGWLTAGLTGTALNLAARTAGLTARQTPYVARVLVTSSYGGEDTVAVSFTVAPGGSPPRLALSLDSLRFAGLVGQTDPPPQTVTGFNAGGGILGALGVRDVVYDSTGAGWLTTAVSGPVLTLSPAAAGLRSGLHRASVLVSSASGGDAVLQVAFDLGQPVLRLSTRSITFSDTLDSADPLRSQVFLTNTGSGTRSDLGTVELGTVSYSGPGSAWLQTVPAMGQAVEGFMASLEATAADVPEGTSIARVPFRSQWGGADTVTVTLTARRPDRSFDLPTIELVRTTTVNGATVIERLPGDSLVVNAVAHSTAQIGVRLGIRNAAETRLTLSGLRVGMPTYTNGKGDWISGAFLNRTSATLGDPAELFVAIEPAALDAGRYEAQLVVRSEAAGLAQVQPVTLRLILRVQ